MAIYNGPRTREQALHDDTGEWPDHLPRELIMLHIPNDTPAEAKAKAEESQKYWDDLDDMMGSRRLPNTFPASLRVVPTSGAQLYNMVSVYPRAIPCVEWLSWWNEQCVKNPELKKIASECSALSFSDWGHSALA